MLQPFDEPGKWGPIIEIHSRNKVLIASVRWREVLRRRWRHLRGPRKLIRWASFLGAPQNDIGKLLAVGDAVDPDSHKFHDI